MRTTYGNTTKRTKEYRQVSITYKQDNETKILIIPYQTGYFHGGKPAMALFDFVEQELGKDIVLINIKGTFV